MSVRVRVDEGTRTPETLARNALSVVMIFAVVSVLYVIGAELAWRIFGAAEIGLVFFPPAGVTLAALVLLPLRRWWVVVCAIVVCEVTVDLRYGLPIHEALGYAAANSLEPLVGAALLRWSSTSPLRLDRREGMLRFLVAAVGVGAAVGGVVGGLTKAMHSDVAWWSAAWHWWAGDGVAILAIGAAIIACHGRSRPRGAQIAELLVGLVVVVVASVVAFARSDVPTAFLVLPLLVAVALRFGVAGVLAASAVMATIANVETAAGRGPFAALEMSAQAQLAYAQLSLLAMITTAWIVAIESSARAELAAEREREQFRYRSSEAERELAELAAALVGGVSVDDVAQRITSHLTGRDSPDLCAVLIQDAQSDSLELFPSTLPVGVRTEASGWGRPQRARRTDSSSLASPVWADTRSSLIDQFPMAANLASLAAVGTAGVLPLHLGDSAHGYLLVARQEQRPYDPEDRARLVALARLVGAAIERARLTEAERHAHAELQRAHELVTVVLQQVTDEAARLKESEERFALLADQSPLMVWVHDGNGAQQWVNQTFCRFFGIDREAMIEDRWQALVHPDDVDDYGAAFLLAVQRRSPFHGHARVLNAAGDWRRLESWAQPRFDPSGLFLGHVGASADMTDRHQAEAELAAAHRFVQDVTSLVPGVIAVFDLRTGRNTFVTRQTSELLGYEPDDVVSLGERFIEKVLHPDDVHAFEAHMERSRQLAVNQSASVEYRFRHKDGRWRWFRTASVALQHSIDGTVAQLANLTIDTSEQKDREAEVVAAAARDAFRARLVDTLTALDGEESILTVSARQLADHLGTTVAGTTVAGTTDADATVRCVAFDDRDRVSLGAPSTTRTGESDELIAFARHMLEANPDGHFVSVADLPDDDRFGFPERATATRLGIRSIMIHAMRNDQELGGLVVAHRSGVHHWSRHEIAALEDVADRVGRAIERERQRRASEVQRTRSDFLVELLSNLEAQPSVDACLSLLVATLVPAIADFASVERFTPDHQILALEHRDPAKVPVLKALRERHHLIAADAVSSELASQSHIDVPLDLGRGMRGALFVGTTDHETNGYTRADLAFMTDLARRVEHVLAAKRLRQAEHHVAVTLQSALLPDTVHWHPAAAVQARYIAASAHLQVGGDWYDTFSWPDGHLGVMVGDVVGHDLDSAAAMGRLRAAAAALAAISPPSPSALLTALDRFARTSDGVDYATAACVVIDPSTGTLTYASAGHPPSLLIAPDGTVRRLDGAQSPPLAVLELGDRSETSVSLEPGSLVFLYTDGLIERRRECIDVGITRLETAIVSRFDQHTSAIVDGVIAELTASSAPEDDVVVAAFRYSPALDQLHVSVPARPEHLAHLRRHLRDWLTSRHATPDTHQAVQVVIGEACTNAIDHAYRQPAPRSNGDRVLHDGEIFIELVDHGHEIVARVSDRGTWRPPGSHGTGRGYGTPIMRALGQRFQRTTTATGTTVTLSFPAELRRPVTR